MEGVTKVEVRTLKRNLGSPPPTQDAIVTTRIVTVLGADPELNLSFPMLLGRAS